jgi:hypothetical protein
MTMDNCCQCNGDKIVRVARVETYRSKLTKHDFYDANDDSDGPWYDAMDYSCTVSGWTAREVSYAWDAKSGTFKVVSSSGPSQSEMFDEVLARATAIESETVFFPATVTQSTDRLTLTISYNMVGLFTSTVYETNILIREMVISGETTWETVRTAAVDEIELVDWDELRADNLGEDPEVFNNRILWFQFAWLDETSELDERDETPPLFRGRLSSGTVDGWCLTATAMSGEAACWPDSTGGEGNFLTGFQDYTDPGYSGGNSGTLDLHWCKVWDSNQLAVAISDLTDFEDVPEGQTDPEACGNVVTDCINPYEDDLTVHLIEDEGVNTSSIVVVKDLPDDWFHEIEDRPECAQDPP